MQISSLAKISRDRRCKTKVLGKLGRPPLHVLTVLGQGYGARPKKGGVLTLGADVEQPDPSNM